jgi:UDP-GlcNAc:undecaprenyl-phosphate GlcNAc-1-phosphate transferase
MPFDQRTTTYAIALVVSFGLALVSIPLCRWIALKLDIVDKPGGRKEHRKVTPLLGGLGMYLASLGTVVLMAAFLEDEPVRESTHVTSLWDLHFLFLGATVIFLTGLLDDVIKRKKELAYYYKLMGQVVAIGLAMLIMSNGHLDNVLKGNGHLRDYAYLFFFLLWLLTTINSFNYSDNINGLMSGLAVIGILASIVYLPDINFLFIVLGFILVGGILGFIPFNFPRARIFIGDAGSMFIGFWVGVFTWPLVGGFRAPSQDFLFGLDHLIPPFLILGVPLFDACFVLIMRLKEGRPIYLGDNQHLSHRLVRTGFNVTETSLLLWGMALILSGIGAMSISASYVYRIVAFLFGICFLVGVTLVILRAEKRAMLREAED